MIEYFVSFLIFIFLQGLFINGVYCLFQGDCLNDLIKGKVCEGSLFFKISPNFFIKHKDKYWAKNLWRCPRCMASTYSLITFFPTVIYIFGFKWVEIPIWAFDSICLISVNWYIFKKL